MKNYLAKFALLLVLFILLSSLCVGLGNSPISIKKGQTALLNDDGNGCFVFGMFKLLHIKDLTMRGRSNNPYDTVEDINSNSTFKVTIKMINTQTKEDYTFKMVPFIGSSTTYYPQSRQVKEVQELYWFLEVPAGTYEVTEVSCMLSLKMSGYYDYDHPLFNYPISQFAQRKVIATLQPKQIVYLGDYDANFRSNILLFGVGGLGRYFNFKLDVNNNLEAAKAILVEGADPKLPEKIKNYSISSALGQ